MRSSYLPVPVSDALISDAASWSSSPVHPRTFSAASTSPSASSEDELVESIAQHWIGHTSSFACGGEPFAPPHLVQAYVAVSSMMPLSTRRSGVK